MVSPAGADAAVLAWAAIDVAHALTRGRCSGLAPGELALTQALMHALLTGQQPQLVACWDEHGLPVHTSKHTRPAHRPQPLGGPPVPVFLRKRVHVLTQKEETAIGADWLIVLADASGGGWQALLVQAKVMTDERPSKTPGLPSTGYAALKAKQTDDLLRAQSAARGRGWPLKAFYAFYNHMPFDCPNHFPSPPYDYTSACVEAAVLLQPAQFGVTLVPAARLPLLGHTPGGEYTAAARQEAGKDGRPLHCILECVCADRGALPPLFEGEEAAQGIPLPEPLRGLLLGELDDGAVRSLLVEALQRGSASIDEPPVAGVLVAQLTSDAKASTNSSTTS